jgi:hypothetical protein
LKRSVELRLEIWDNMTMTLKSKGLTPMGVTGKPDPIHPLKTGVGGMDGRQ